MITTAAHDQEQKDGMMCWKNVADSEDMRATVQTYADGSARHRWAFFRLPEGRIVEFSVRTNADGSLDVMSAMVEQSAGPRN